MDTPDIIGSILAGLTFIGIIVAMILGILATRESRNLQKVQYREELLNGILNWLSDVSECGTRYNTATLSQARDEGMNGHSAKTSRSLIAGNVANAWMSLSNRGQILRMSFPDKHKPIPKTITILIKGMRKLCDLNRKYRLAFIDLPDDMAKVADLMEKLNEETEEIQQKYVRKTKERIANEVAKLKYTKAFS